MEPTPIQQYNEKLTEEFAEFVMKSIITDKSKRFGTAKDMLAALEKIGLDGILKDTTMVSIINNPEDNGNPVDYINSLYSQSRHGNRGTRAGSHSHAFDSLTYTATKLDKELLGDIRQLKYKLIIITGNAGDGKTAFIHRIENIGENKVTFESNNGSSFDISGVKFQTNYSTLWNVLV